MRFSVSYEPRGKACNMRYCVRDTFGNLYYRGPQWAAVMRANRWNGEGSE